MSAVCKSLQSYLKIEDGDRRINNSSSSSEQLGIGSILGCSDNKKLTKAGSLRRTFSADMSSKKWLAQQQLFSLKKIASSEQIMNISPASPSSSSDEDEVKGEVDIWSSIELQKKSDSKSAQPNYVHPLVKRSTSTLSKNSLEICTESLGSETGFDCSSETDSSFFSSSEDEDFSSGEEEEYQQEKSGEFKDPNHGLTAVNYNCSISRKSPACFFPPPLSSISRRDGPCFHMRSVRQEGRLVLQAVPVPSHNYLHAQRQDGRLILSFTNPPISDERKSNFPVTQVEKTHEIDYSLEHKFQNVEEVEEEPQKVIEEEEEEEENEDREEEEEVKNLVDTKLRQQLPNFVQSTLVINKIISKQFVNLNPWSQKLEKEQDRTKVAKITTFNSYEYPWRKPFEQQKQQQQQQQQQQKIGQEFLRDKGDLPSRRCQEPRKSPSFWEPFCIATS